LDFPTSGLKEALRLRPNLIILALMLPKVNGYEVCRFLREEKLEMPIVLLNPRFIKTVRKFGNKFDAR
jgi:DNA-binding response OmpR family regulator